MLALIAKAEKNRQQSETRRDVEEKAEKEEKTRQGSALMDPIERQRSLLQKAEHSAAYDPSGYAPYHHTVSTRQRRMTTWRDGRRGPYTRQSTPARTSSTVSVGTHPVLYMTVR